MSPADAKRFGLRDRDEVSVEIKGHSRVLTFGDVIVRVSPDYRLEMHLDTDEANAAGILPHQDGVLLLPTEARAALTTSRDFPKARQTP